MVRRANYSLGFIYKIGEIILAGSKNSGVQLVGLLCVEQNTVGSNIVLDMTFFFSSRFFFFCRISVYNEVQ